MTAIVDVLWISLAVVVALLAIFAVLPATVAGLIRSRTSPIPARVRPRSGGADILEH
jgi:hypothetical protein